MSVPCVYQFRENTSRATHLIAHRLYVHTGSCDTSDSHIRIAAATAAAGAHRSNEIREYVLLARLRSCSALPVSSLAHPRRSLPESARWARVDKKLLGKLAYSVWPPTPRSSTSQTALSVRPLTFPAFHCPRPPPLLPQTIVAFL